MNGSKVGSRNSRRRRIKVAPVTRAVRIALAASATALVLAGTTGTALAATCPVQPDGSLLCSGLYVDDPIDILDVDDLTVVLQGAVIANATGTDNALPFSVVTTGDGATATVDMSADVLVTAEDGNAIGAYVYAPDGNVDITSSSLISVASNTGYASGIFAAGENVSVATDNMVSVNGGYWAAGIEVEATDLAVVANSADITVTASGQYAQAYGIDVYAGLGGATVSNDGTIYVAADYGTGIAVEAQGPVSVTNTGDVYVIGNSPYYSYGIVATGIQATTSDASGDIAVDNSGTIVAVAGYGATGIDVAATGVDASVSVVNSGDITAVVNNPYFYDATGIVASGQLDSGIVNDGTITVYTPGNGYGAMALAFNGEASVTNTGDIEVHAAGYGYTGASGVVASSSNGTAVVDNSGSIAVSSYYYAHGIDATGTAGAAVTNSGSVTSNAWINYGIHADGGAGDVAITNTGTGTVTAYYSGNFYGLQYGIDGTTTGGDVAIVNDGSVAAGAVDGYGHAVGIKASSGTGSVSVDNGGTIHAASSDDQLLAPSLSGQVTGILATAGDGASVSNDGSVYAYTSGSGARAVGIYAGTYSDTDPTVGGDVSIASGADGLVVATSQQNYAFAMYGATGAGDIVIDNAGHAYAGALYVAAGVVGRSVYGDVAADNSGVIEAGALGVAAGMMGVSYYGNVALSSTGDIEASAYDNAIGMGAQSGGDAGLANSGSIVASATNGSAFGMQARAYAGSASIVNGEGGSVVAAADQDNAYAALAMGDVAAVTNAGDLTANGYDYAYGVLARGMTSASLDNAGGNIEAKSDGYAYGAIVNADYGDANADNTGTISASSTYGDATGLIVSGYGATFAGSGAITATAADGDAYGAIVDAVAGDADVLLGTGTISANGADDATGLRVRSEDGNVAIVNAGGIEATSANGSSLGILGLGYSSTSITNTGAVEANGRYATGVVAVTYDGDVAVDNGGGIAATSTGVAYYAETSGIYAASQGATAVHNTGEVAASAAYGDANAIYATGESIEVASSGDTTATTAHGVAHAIVAYGDGIAISNGGNATAHADAYAVAIGAYGSGSASVTNDGALDAVSSTSYAAGIYASADEVEVLGGAGSIHASGVGLAAGIQAFAYSGSVTVDTANDIEASADDAVAIDARAATNVSVSAAGDMSVEATDATRNGIGIFATSQNADASVAVAGTADVAAAGKAWGVFASAPGDVHASVAGSISASSSGEKALGMELAAGGSLTLAGDGSIGAVSETSYATGLLATATGDASIVGNAYVSADAALDATGIDLTAGGDVKLALGSVSAVSDGASAYGVVVAGDGIAATTTGDLIVLAQDGDLATGITLDGLSGVSLDNSGHVMAHGGSAMGVGLNGATASFTNSGGVEVDGNGVVGVKVRGDSAALTNAGSITSTGGHARGAVLTAGADGASATNSGSIAATSAGAYDASALNAYSGGDVSFANSGSITANADGAYASATLFVADGSVDASNAGSITAGGDTAAALYALGVEGVDIANAGTISAGGATDANAIYAIGYYGEVGIVNSGTISASASDSAVAVTAGYATAAHITNSGTITASGAGEGNIAVLGLYAPLTLANTGTISGAIVTYEGDDAVENGGIWNVANHATDLGAGDDAIHNLAGGTIALHDGAIHLGSSTEAGNSFLNEGTIGVSGESLIDMGTGVDVAPAGMFTAMSVSPMAAPNPAAFMNDGIIDFVDGSSSDVLTIAGDFGGVGDINLDVNLVNGTSDLLYIDGDVIDGTQQTVNLAVDDIGSITDPVAAQFLTVSGSVADGAFLPGEVIGFGADNFLDLKVNLTQGADGDATVFSIDTTVAGLNRVGVLAANVAPAAQTLIASAIGTLRQRNGALGNASDYGMGPWVRFFDNSGDVDPAHTQDFGTAGDFRFEQMNRGLEFGMGFDFDGPVSIGVLLGNADAKQTMHDGSGSDHLEMSSVGVYGTWAMPAFYVDLSFRWMDLDATLMSSAGETRTSGNATASNIEAGYTGWNMGGFDIVPQAQYTRSTVDVDALHGSIASFDNGSNDSARGRLGVEVSRSFDAAGFSWKPYAAASVVREFEGEGSYTIADTFSGTTSIEGTSSLLEAGIGARIGGFSGTFGVNWSDGGALRSQFGGNLVLRYSW